MSDTKAQPKKKAKRRLSDFDFSSETAHIALVDQAANERSTLVMKSVKFTEEEIQKIQQVRVTMELPDFLQKFFNLYYEDSYLLSRMMGYVSEENEVEIESYEDYLESKLESFEIIKSLNESPDIASVLSELDANTYISVLKTQQIFEKAFYKDKEKAKVVKATKRDGSTDVKTKVGADKADSTESRKPAVKIVKMQRDSSGGWKPTDLNTVKQEENMSEKDKPVVTEATVEVVEKSTFESMQEELQKALTKQNEELQKALQLVKQFEEEKKEAVTKARFESVKGAVKDEAKATLLFKAVSLVEDQAEFESIVKALKDMTDLAEKSDLFVEKGVSAESEGTDVKKDSPVAKLLKAQNKK